MPECRLVGQMAAEPWAGCLNASSERGSQFSSAWPDGRQFTRHVISRLLDLYQTADDLTDTRDVQRPKARRHLQPCETDCLIEIDNRTNTEALNSEVELQVRMHKAVRGQIMMHETD